LVEEGLLSPQEIEVAILGNKDLIVSEPGELVLVKEFYSYDAKYKNNETQIRIPANLSETDKHSIQTLAKRIYKLSECCGFARIDFFLSKGEIYINEINTLP
jgi:D-alanine-D-alanine ligase